MRLETLCALPLVAALLPCMVPAQPPRQARGALDHVRTAAGTCGIRDAQITLAAATTPRGTRFQTVHVIMPRREGYALEGIRAFLRAIEKDRPDLCIREVDFGEKDRAKWRLRTVSVAIRRPSLGRIPSALARLDGFLSVCNQATFRGRLRLQRLRVSWAEVAWDMTFASLDPQRTMEELREALQSRVPNVESCHLGQLTLQTRLRLGCLGCKLAFRLRWGPTAEAVGARVVSALTSLAPRAQEFRLDGRKLSFTLSVIDERALVQSLEAIRESLNCDGYYLKAIQRGPTGLSCRVILTLP